MCLILFAINQHPKYNLIAAANRDEFYKRPTADAEFWNDHPHVLAGRDLLAKGTWMGINRYGRIAMLTNYRDLSNLKANAPSRGNLVADYLIKNDVSHQQYEEELISKGPSYNGFNLLFGNRNFLTYYSNIAGQPEKIEKGIYGLSNHLLNTEWPKIIKGKKVFSELLHDKENLSPEAFLEALYDDIKAPDHLLPDTGVGLEFERVLSPMFIKSLEYGSRCSTVVLADINGNWSFYERVYDVRDFSYRTNAYEFKELSG